MTSFRFHWRPSRREDRLTGSLFIRVIHNRRYKDLGLDHRVTAEEWDGKARTVRLAAGEGNRRAELQAIHLSVLEDARRLQSIIDNLSDLGDFTVYDVCRLFRQDQLPHTLEGYCTLLARKLETEGQVRTARAYLSTARSVSGFCRRRINIADIDAEFIRSYERYLFDCSLKMNTVSFYMRNLRAVYNRAIKARIISGQRCNPFEDVFTGVFETKRRALDQQELSKLAEMDQSVDPLLKDALKYFMFAFHARGMSFIDLAYLKKSDIKGDTILYKRKKTGFFIELRITRPMKKIINYFRNRTKNSPYVFPVIKDTDSSHRKQYETALARQNKLLKELAETAHINKTLSTHVARHTWATIAKRMGYAIPLISEALGHRDIKVTSIYLASFERSAMDELSNRLSKIIKAA